MPLFLFQHALVQNTGPIISWFKKEVSQQRAAPPTATGQVSVQSLLILWVEFCPSKFHTLES